MAFRRETGTRSLEATGIECGDLRSATNIELGIDIGEVVFDRFLAETKELGDLFVGQAFSHQGKQALFLRGEEGTLRLSWFGGDLLEPV